MVEDEGRAAVPEGLAATDALPAALMMDDSEDDDFNYEQVHVASEPEEDDISEDLEAAMRSLQALTMASKAQQCAGQVGHADCAAKPSTPPGAVVRRPEVVDDFIRNVCARMGLTRTAEAFESEWYELRATGQLAQEPRASLPVPDVYMHNEELGEELAALRTELAATRDVATRASATWERFRRERDFHRLHHKRVAQEKDRLITDIKRLKAHYAKYEPTILELKRKYEVAMKEKMLVGMERDKMAAKVHALEERLRAQPPDHYHHHEEQQQQQAQQRAAEQPLPKAPLQQTHLMRHSCSPGALQACPAAYGRAIASPIAGTRGGGSAGGSPWPREVQSISHDMVQRTPAQVAAFTCQCSFKGHLLPVANVALHPSKPVLATASDDKTWKLWHLPAGDLIMCGEGHRDWVAGVDFHPGGMSLASASGDGSIKLWSFERQRCIMTLSDHKQAVWSVKHHDQGDWLASCSLDHSVRLWDLALGRCRQVLRGHVDSVNDIDWQPCGATICTASSDKTVSTWDPRSGLSTATLYGHTNSCNGVAFAPSGAMLASSDADGAVKLWDTRMVAEVTTLRAGRHPANRVAFDGSGALLAVASDDGRVRVFDSARGDLVTELAGHEDAVQAAVFDRDGGFLVSCGSDNAFKLWAA